MSPDDFEIRETDSYIVKTFKENKIHMWFQEDIEGEHVVYNNLPL